MTHLIAGSPTPILPSTFTTYVEQTPKLCGFLLKQSDSSAASNAASKAVSAAASAAATIGLHANAGRLPMRKRWFVFNETTCRLYWYKSPSDLEALGDIDIVSAAFEVVVKDPKNMTTFMVNTNDRSLTLEASDRKTMMYWLQELQSQRQKHVKTLTRNGPPGMRLPRPPSPRNRRKLPSLKVASSSTVNDSNKKTGPPSTKPFADSIDVADSENVPRTSFDELLPRVSVPVDSVGAGSAILGGAGSALQLSRRESFTKRSLKGKMLKLLPGGRKSEEYSPAAAAAANATSTPIMTNEALVKAASAAGMKTSSSVSTENTEPTLSNKSTTDSVKIESTENLINFGGSPSLLAAKELPKNDRKNSHDNHDEDGNGIRILNKSPDLHRRAVVSSSSLVTTPTSSSHATPLLVLSHAPKDEGTPSFGSSTTSLPDATNQNLFAAGLSNLFKPKHVSPSVSSSNLSSPPCQRCHALADQLRVTFKEIESLRDERDAQRDCHNILTQQLEFQQRKLDARDSTKDAGDSTRWAEDREKELQNLKSVLRKNQEDLEIRRRKVDGLEAEAKKTGEQIEMLQELVKCKDDVVHKLTDQLYEAETKSSHMMEGFVETAAIVTSVPTPISAPTPTRLGSAFFPKLNISSSSPASAATSPPTTCNHCEKQIIDLEMELAAYKFQNQVCNKEILEQNQLRTDLHDWGRQLCEQLVEAEAKLCQAKSERDFLLNEKKKARDSKSSGASVSPISDSDDVLERMIEDAMKEAVVVEGSMAPYDDEDTVVAGIGKSQFEGSNEFGRNGLYYDEYGFLKGQNSASGSGDDNALLTKAKSFDMYSRDLQDSLGEPGDYEVSRRVKWENYMTSQWAMGGAGTMGDVVRSPDLKFLVRMGIPSQYRWNIWRSCVSHWLSGKDEDIGGQSWASKIGTSYYQDLVDASDSSKPTSTLTRDGTLTSASLLMPIEKQIELDLLRTLPNNRLFSNINSEMVLRLRRVLRAFARHNISIGYCQGMNRLAAIPLLILPSEEDAFWCLVAIIDHIMPESYFGNALISAQADQRVLKELLNEKCPRLANHLERLAVDLSLFTFNWFLCLFVDTIPPDIYLKIWDAFLYEGPKVLFRFALAFLKLHEETLLAAPDYMTACAILRSLGEDALTSDWRALSFVAFESLNPFPLRNIKNRRKACVAQVKAELEELENIRQKYRRESKRENSEKFSESDDEA